MKALNAECEARLAPRPMQLVGTGKERGTDRPVDILATPHQDVRSHAAYYRRQDETPEPYPLFKTDRFGKTTCVGVATPTAPLRRVR